MLRKLAVLMCVALAVAGCITRRDAYFREGKPAHGLNEMLGPGSAPLHIVFLHGMRATGSGGSAVFREALCARLPDCKGPLESTVRKIALQPRQISYLGQAIWRDEAEWNASAPIVHRYVYANGANPPVIVDEVNWWPLLLPVKCRRIVAHDAALVGVSQESLDVCAATGRFKDEEHYAWLNAKALEEIRKNTSLTGGGAKLNRILKTEIMDWGLSDAVMTTGPLGDTIGEGIGAALAWSAATPVRGLRTTAGGARRFAVISESLGSFVVFDYYMRHHDKGVALTGNNIPIPSATSADQAAYGVVQVLDNTDKLYFLANQVALLELSRLTVRMPSGAALAEPTPKSVAEGSQTVLDGLANWSRRTKGGSGASLAEPGYSQIVAFHDPNDALTFEVPKPLGEAAVYNVFVANGPTYLGLLADPGRAHTAHARNSCVLQIIFEADVHGPCKVAKQPG